MHLRRRDTRDTIRENERREINKKKTKKEEKEMKKEEEVFVECKKVYASNSRIYIYIIRARSRNEIDGEWQRYRKLRTSIVISAECNELRPFARTVILDNIA